MPACFIVGEVLTSSLAEQSRKFKQFIDGFHSARLSHTSNSIKTGESAGGAHSHVYISKRSAWFG